MNISPPRKEPKTYRHAVVIVDGDLEIISSIYQSESSRPSDVPRGYRVLQVGPDPEIGMERTKGRAWAHPGAPVPVKKAADKAVA